MFSSENLDFAGVALWRNDIADSIHFYYGQPSISTINPKFIGYTRLEMENERDERLNELDKSSSLNLLAAVEAVFRIDFETRCVERHKDELSRHFRSLRKKAKGKPHLISLDQEILDGWKKFHSSEPLIISDLKAAFLYRHWLAHGRYWKPKLGRVHDFDSLYLLAQTVMERLPLKP